MEIPVIATSKQRFDIDQLITTTPSSPGTRKSSRTALGTWSSSTRRTDQEPGFHRVEELEHAAEEVHALAHRNADGELPRDIYGLVTLLKPIFGSFKQFASSSPWRRRARVQEPPELRAA